MQNQVLYGPSSIILCNEVSGSRMYFESSRNPPRWRCNGVLVDGVRCCNGKTLSYRTDSFFSHHHTPKEIVLEVLYHWSVKSPRTLIAHYTGLDHKTISNIISNWYQMLQEDFKNDDCMIGGIDDDGNPIIVEIDESKFGKRKYHRGHSVEGAWIVGGVEHTPQRKCFLLVVPDRTALTLDDIILNHVKPGSIVRTDCWRAYTNMTNLGMNLQHQTVNHSEGFRDGEVHTNTIEGEIIIRLKCSLFNIYNFLIRYMEWHKNQHPSKTSY